jgi:hypothetical protein
MNQDITHYPSFAGRLLDFWRWEETGVVREAEREKKPTLTLSGQHEMLPNHMFTHLHAPRSNASVHLRVQAQGQVAVVLVERQMWQSVEAGLQRCQELPSMEFRWITQPELDQ